MIIMHLAGYKIRQWREGQDPSMSAEMFGLKYGDPWPSRTIYGWESKGKIARAPVQRKLADLGICSPSDWLTPVTEGGIHFDKNISKKDENDWGERENSFFDIRGHGMVRIATSTPKCRTADVTYNADQILAEAERAHEAGVDLVVYPELCLSSYAIDDLHLQSALLDAVEVQIDRIAKASIGFGPALLVGLPLRYNARVYNCAALVAQGKIIGVVPKSFLPNYREYYEKRWFAHGRNIKNAEILISSEYVPFGVDILFSANNMLGFKLCVELCEDYWAPTPPSTRGALAGATVLANLSASNITIGKSDERHLLARAQSSRAVAAYIYSASGHGESTTDLAWDGQGMIYELGDLLAESDRFSLDSELCIADIDCDRILAERARMQTFNDAAEAEGRPEEEFRKVEFTFAPSQGDRGLVRPIRRFPFVPNREHRLNEDCYEAFNIQVDGLIRRLESTRAKTMVIGISGGLDSTHALIVAAKCCDRIGLPRSFIRGYTMPGFATSAETKSNAWALMKSLGITAEEVDIRPAAMRMLEDLQHPFAKGEPVHDVTFENVQAGLRTDYLFRLAGHHSGFVVGTGDLSELALGWCTYGVGDQMSHYAVNSGVPKTLIQYLIRWSITTEQFDPETDGVLLSILDTEISPELVPSKADGDIQSTESIVGPFELNDFFLHHIIRWGQRPSKVAFLAWHAWKDSSVGVWPARFPEGKKNEYDLLTIREWLQKFLQRFFGFSQFKRSAIPNGPKVSAGGALSPRGDWRAPSDAVADVWIDELLKNVPTNLN